MGHCGKPAVTDVQLTAVTQCQAWTCQLTASEAVTTRYEQEQELTNAFFLALQLHFLPAPSFPAFNTTALSSLLPITEYYLRKQVEINSAFLSCYNI